MAVESSILDSIKKVLGIDSEYTVYDEDVMMHANSAFATLQQLHVGPETAFYLESKDQKWNSVITSPEFNMIKTYVYQYVRLRFDPPDKGYELSAIQDTIKELEWRLNVLGERKGYV